MPHKPSRAQHFPIPAGTDAGIFWNGRARERILGPLGISRELSPGLGWPRVTRDSGKGLKGEMGKV